MKHTEDSHVLSLRDLSTGWGSGSHRAHLDLAALLTLIRAHDASADVEFDISKRTGKKRAAPASSQYGPRKRGRVQEQSSQADPSTTDEDPKAAASHEDSVSFPVYRHVSSLQYNTVVSDSPGRLVANEEHANDLGWLQEEEELKAWLKKMQQSASEQRWVELGEMGVLSMLGHAIQLRSPSITSSKPFLAIPRPYQPFSLEEHDMRWPSLRDEFFACHHLCSVGRAEMSANLKLEILPPGDAQEQLPFRLHAEITGSLISPAIFEPIHYSTKAVFAELEEAQRRFLSFVLPERPAPNSFHGSVDIPLLFSILGPAPSIYHGFLDESVQPPNLIPTLLPFQRRSVAWMLDREGKAISEDGEVIPKPRSGTDALPLFWERVDVTDSVSWYYHRITGRVSRERPKDENAKALGGILAEEPGLGKTLECISLILLNPAIGRNPTTKTWDPEAKVDVKEVKTTLIVTPPVLAPQWADELAAHAPGLKVLIYDGWQKLPVPITEAEAIEAREARSKQKNKQKARSARAKSAALKSKAKDVTSRKGKGKAKQVDDDDVEMKDVDEENEEELEEDIVDWCTYVNRFDVVITTYTVLQHDLSVARPLPVRPRRANVVYGHNDRSRSPLIMCEWYRVIMDEVQMVGGGKTEEMVSLIPRLSSFAVSGTPARAQVSDLIHVVKFLRIKDVVETPRVWARLLKPAYVSQFTELFQRYTVRTMKSAVEAELTIPKQTRYLLPVELGKVERHVYDHNFEKALLDLGLDARGVAVTEDWEVDTTVLRTWLRKLRGICTHPQVGQLQNQADKLHKPGVLKSIGEVLEDMRDKNWRNMMEDWRNKVQTLTSLAQLQQQTNSKTKYRSALNILLSAEKEANNLIAAIQSAIKEHDAHGKVLKAQALAAREELEDEVAMDKGKGKAREREDSPMSETSEEDSDLPKNAIGKEHADKRRALHSRLREAQISLHKVHFLKGDVYHALGESYAKTEDEAYGAAEELRRLLLSTTEESARKAMARLLHEAHHSITEEQLQIAMPYCGQGGIKSAHLMEEANDMIDEVLNLQGALIWKWRSHLVGLLTQSLTNSDNADGQEYSRSLDTQGEAETYLQNYVTLLADRREALNSERTLLAVHEGKETKSRNTKAAVRAAALAMDPEVIEELGDLLADLDAPQNQVLHVELSTERKTILEDFDSSRALRSVMVDLNNIAAGIAREQDPERIIAKDGATQLRSLLNEQMKLIENLQADCALIRRAFNDRVSYFRQLQELSDTVTEAQWEGTLADAITKEEQEYADFDVKVNAGRARQRYLDHLAKAQEDGTVNEDDECCILCKCEFVRGYITQCAHVFCEGCMKSWLDRKEGKACPVCRVAINTDQLQRFAVADPNSKIPAVAPPKIVNNEYAPRSSRTIEYNLAPTSLMESIDMMESHGSFGSKIQTLVRHLLYLNVSDPGCKTIVFSAWADSLNIINFSLKENGIKALRGDQNSGKRNAAKIFRTDPSYQVLLLHGERENAGLNVTCASRVILVESVVNHAFEVQAIARIDRMGQTKPTEVYCYYAEETVEKNILDLAAKQGQSLYTKDNAGTTLNVNPLATTQVKKEEVDAPSKKAPLKGDFVFKTDDMLAIFFPHLFEDIEFLVPPDEAMVNSDINPDQPPVVAGSSTGSRYANENAVAGPSRLG
ncbi:SNF2 family N-terminal domain-containing protein [Cristinia sonorae]|uniref:SNF2 family N-terminal domain-containing protein n=1 Tax=Cristinia sonorae TaxID=1940300 RepID=A0A8K0UQW0_9AGAR|nr:SNF2 family N-terminal domain-containing protein [Cristinia sonorae]